MTELSKSAHELHHMVRLNQSFRSDLQWWAHFLPVWNGIGMMSGVVPASFVATLTSDASGSWGCGAYLATGEWFQIKWPGLWEGVHITIKELLPIVVAELIAGRYNGAADAVT